MRLVLLALGIVLLAITWMGPLTTLAVSAFSAHMTMHMTVVAVAAPLVALGLAGGRFDPVRAAPAFVAPLPASLLEFAVVWTWHAPALHDAARQNAGVLTLEQASFFGAGLILWSSVFGGDPALRVARAGAGVMALLLTSMHMTLLGALLALAPRPLYAQAGSVRALPALADQHLGGAIMLAVGGAAYLAGGLWLMAGVLRKPAPWPGGRA